MAEPHHVVVDGSNLATEGRTSPSLGQLDEAVRAYAGEDPGSHIIVVVDATFEHRVSEEERAEVREAMLNGELVSPPAGAIGRGDAFVLRIAERTGAIVLSNDSFQEFHGEHPWLFEEGRLVGGKPVPGVGWIFTPRLPIRGPKSRAATAEAKAKADPTSAPAKAAELARAAQKAAKRATKAKRSTVQARTSVREQDAVVDTAWPIVPSVPPPGRAKVDPVFSSAIDEALEEALRPPTEGKGKGKKSAKQKVTAGQDGGPPAQGRPKVDGRAPTAPSPDADSVTPPVAGVGGRGSSRDGRSRKKRSTPPPAVNEPLAFINFVAAYPVDSVLEGEVVSFTSHGAMVDVALPAGGALHCYVPLSAMGTPPPTKARQVLKKGEVRPFVLAGLDPPRRVAELSLALTVPGAEDLASSSVDEVATPGKPTGVKKVTKAEKAPRDGNAAAKKGSTVDKAAKAKKGASVKKAAKAKAAKAKKAATVKKAAGANKAATVKKATGANKAAKAKKDAPKAKLAVNPTKKAAKGRKQPAVGRAAKPTVEPVDPGGS